VRAFPDASFLCALYRQQVNSDRALVFMEGRNDPLPISALLRFEFLHGVRREVFRNANDRHAGLSLSVAVGVIAAFEEDFQLGRLRPVEIDLPNVIKRAEMLSEGYATARGYRAFDTLLVATALALGFAEMLTFDGQQRTLAEAEGLSVPF
jgi:predicted nucleic acid-binding protein